MKLNNLLTDILIEDKKNIPNVLDGTFYLEYFLSTSEAGIRYNVEIKRPGEKVGNSFSYENIKKDNGDVSKMVVNGFKIAAKLGLIKEKDNKADLVIKDGKIKSINGIEIEELSVKQPLNTNQIKSLEKKLSPEGE